jgi:ribosomal protein S9
VQEVRDDQIRVFTTSGASDVEAREAAHGIIRALNQIETKLDAAITAETFLDRKQRK